MWWVMLGKPHPWEQKEKPAIENEEFSSTYHHTAAQAEVLKLCTEVQNAQ